jgi:hypothetical protein
MSNYLLKEIKQHSLIIFRIVTNKDKKNKNKKETRSTRKITTTAARDPPLDYVL